MEFYKLYKLIHKRTDWERLSRWAWRIMFPEEYEAEKGTAIKRREHIYKTLRVINTIMGGY